MSETCEHWSGLENSCICYARQTREIVQAATALLSGFQSSKE